MRIVGFAAIAIALAASSGAEVPAGAGTSAGPLKFQLPPAVAAKANAAKVPDKAGKKTTIGKGKTAINTSNAPGDDDSFWAEEIDIDGDGVVETADVLWDDEDKVLFLYDEGDFPCANGATGSGDMLVAVNGAGNSRNRPAGSGFYLVTLDEGECKAKVAGAHGCKFDASGKPTACGLAELDEKNDDLVIVTVSQ